MTLHIFNPEHDIALASDLSNFTAPHAGRQLCHDLGYLPALWADEGDAVLVDSVDLAERSLRKVVTAGRRLKLIDRQVGVRLVSSSGALSLSGVKPWGWNKALCARLKRGGVDAALLPTDEQLGFIRQLSHRRIAAQLLTRLRREGTLGESFECTRAEEVEALLGRYGRLVLKAPWSSSGRGLRFLDKERTPLQMQAGWLRNLLERQGSVMVEPYYNKVKDFGMEFTALADGTIRYDGLSLFHTTNGAYTGNILATEAAKRQMLSRYIPTDLLDAVRVDVCRLLAPVFQDCYAGPFGIDMMVLSRGELMDTGIEHCGNSNDQRVFCLHPCVEINLRCTMGHVALALAPHDDDIMAVMRIEYNGSTYQLKLTSYHPVNLQSS